MPARSKQQSCFPFLSLLFFDFAGKSNFLQFFCWKPISTLLFEDGLVMAVYFLTRLGADQKQCIRIYLTNRIWRCGLICLRCSHLTGLRLGGISLTFTLFCVGSLALCRLYFLLNNLHIYAPIHPNNPPRNPPPSGLIFSCFTSQLLVLLFALGGRWRSRLKSLPRLQQITRSSPALHFSEDVNTPTYVHMRDPTQVLTVIMQASSGTRTNKHKWMLECSQINTNTVRLIAGFVAVQ